MDTGKEIVRILDDALGLKGRAAHFTPETPLLGSIPELDSMAVLGVLTSIEERFGIVIHDDEVDAAIFATVGSLVRFVDSKLSG